MAENTICFPNKIRDYRENRGCRIQATGIIRRRQWKWFRVLLHGVQRQSAAQAH